MVVVVDEAEAGGWRMDLPRSGRSLCVEIGIGNGDGNSGGQWDDQDHDKQRG